MQESNPFKIVGKQIVYQNQWIKLHEDKVITPSGNEGVYAYVESDDSVIVPVLNEKNEIYVVRSFRYPLGTWNWEFPGGGGAKEHPVEASMRELEEETGIIANKWTKLGETVVCNGLMTETMYTYLAQDLRFDGKKDEADEKIPHGKFIGIDEAVQMVQAGEINDGQTITALFLVMQWLQHSKTS